MNFNIITLGCKVNQYESQAMREDLLKNGFELAKPNTPADITVVNSCTVTSVSDAKNRKLINKINKALKRIDDNDYGYCEETGEEINVKRLMARPIATLSLEAQERHERKERTMRDE